MTESTKTCRSILLGEYTTGNFDLQSKLQSFPESNKRYLPLNERIKMFVADNPKGSIECRVLMDNNIFATVEARITTDSGNIAVAVGKWYHSNNDAYGMNYVKTAQSNAISSALRFLGYDYTEEVEPDPEGNLNYGEVAPLPFAFDDNQTIPLAPAPQVPQGKHQNYSDETPSELTVEQAKSFVINGAPFGSMSIGKILDSGNSVWIDELRRRFTFAVQQRTSLAPAARVLLPLMEV